MSGAVAVPEARTMRARGFEMAFATRRGSRRKVNHASWERSPAGKKNGTALCRILPFQAEQAILAIKIRI